MWTACVPSSFAGLAHPGGLFLVHKATHEKGASRSARSTLRAHDEAVMARTDQSASDPASPRRLEFFFPDKRVRKWF
jgi:hypothetical protein